MLLRIQTFRVLKYLVGTRPSRSHDVDTAREAIDDSRELEKERGLKKHVYADIVLSSHRVESQRSLVTQHRRSRSHPYSRQRQVKIYVHRLRVVVIRTGARLGITRSIPLQAQSIISLCDCLVTYIISTSEQIIRTRLLCDSMH